MIVKLLLLLALVGHIVCGFTDCLLTYGTKGRLNFKDISDEAKMSVMFLNMPLKNPLLSMILGTFSITLMSFGYFGLSIYMEQFSHLCAVLMLIGSIVFFIPITTHHVFCGVVEWFYIRLGRTPKARTAVLEFQKKTMITMYIGYIGLLIFMGAFFIAVVCGQTDLPKWACAINTVPLFLLLSLTKLPAKGNIAGAIMFLGLLFII